MTLGRVNPERAGTIRAPRLPQSIFDNSTQQDGLPVPRATSLARVDERLAFRKIFELQQREAGQPTEPPPTKRLQSRLARSALRERDCRQQCQPSHRRHKQPPPGSRGPAPITSTSNWLFILCSLRISIYFHAGPGTTPGRCGNTAFHQPQRGTRSRFPCRITDPAILR